MGSRKNEEVRKKIGQAGDIAVNKRKEGGKK